MAGFGLAGFAPPLPGRIGGKRRWLGWPALRGGARPSHPQAPAGVAAWLRAAWRRHRARQALLGLNEHMRKDIGIAYADAEREGNKPFWLR